MITSTISRELPLDLDRNRLPHHVAVIMDGNGRWAKRRGQPRIMGHQKGAYALEDLVRCCKDWGIPALTVYAFSTENWSRPYQEVGFIMGLIDHWLRKKLDEMMVEEIRIAFVGDLSLLPQNLQETISLCMEKTAQNQGIQFTIATNYGGRQEILRACRSIAEKVKSGELDIDQIDESLFERHLYTAGLGYPDLLIRTSGELRLSNFLLWQMAYSEIYVTPTLWPDFDRTAFHQALIAYQTRERRFGQVTSQKTL